MNVMASGLKALAGTGLRTTLRKAAATPLSGAFWGAFVTLIVQSSSATTMTTIDLVSAGLLTFSQGLRLVFGANVGTTGTGWLIALIGVRISLAAAALPMIFVGAPVKLLGRGRLSAAGRTVAPIRPSRHFRAGRQLVVRCVRHAVIDRARAGDDGGDAILNRGHRDHAVGLLRGRRRIIALAAIIVLGSFFGSF